MKAPDLQKPFNIRLQNVSYRHANHAANTIEQINLNIGAGDKICLCGISGSGKSTLTDIIAGLLPNYNGSVLINDYSIRDLDLTFYRDHLGSNGSSEDIFDGTWHENISVGNTSVKVEDIIQAIKFTNLQDEISRMPEGLETRIISNGKGLSNSTIQKILLARCVAKNSRLLIIHDHFSAFSRKEKSELITRLIQDESRTILFVSNDPLVMGVCKSVCLLNHGKIQSVGTFKDLMKDGQLLDCIEPN